MPKCPSTISLRPRTRSKENGNGSPNDTCAQASARVQEPSTGALKWARVLRRLASGTVLGDVGSPRSGGEGGCPATEAGRRRLGRPHKSSVDPNARGKPWCPALSRAPRSHVMRETTASAPTEKATSVIVAAAAAVPAGPETCAPIRSGSRAIPTMRIKSGKSSTALRACVK